MDAKATGNGDIWVLVVDDDLDVRGFFSNYLSRQGFKVDSVARGSDAIEFLISNSPDALLLDLRLPDIDGIQVLRETRNLRPNTTAIVMTGFATVTSSVEAMKLGAWNYHVKPIEDPSVIVSELRESTMSKRRRPARSEEYPVRTPERSPYLVGDTAPMKHVLSLAGKAAEVDSSVLICGESGTGKELVAKIIHINCRRKKGKFLAVNCGAVADTLLESTLFGYERGAFTGAYKRTKGYFEAADGGTLFLDEIADTSLQLQAKMLRTLEERAFQRVGGVDTVFTDARIIAATNKNLNEEVATGRFREDLFYRINVLKIDIPPLRQRISDLRPLSAHFLKKHAERMHRKPPKLSEEAMRKLESYAWPGNVRELENVIERALAFSSEGEDAIGVESLPSHLRSADERASAVPRGTQTLAAAREDFEREYIANLLRESNGNISAAARRAGIARQNLYAKMKRYGLNAERR